MSLSQSSLYGKFQTIQDYIVRDSLFSLYIYIYFPQREEPYFSFWVNKKKAALENPPSIKRSYLIPKLVIFISENNIWENPWWWNSLLTYMSMCTYTEATHRGEKSCVLKMSKFMFSEFAIKSHSQGSPQDSKTKASLGMKHFWSPKWSAS